MANSYSISGHELRLNKTEETIEVWFLGDDEAGESCEETFYIGPNEDGLMVWCDDSDLFVEATLDTTPGQEYPLNVWIFKHRVNGGILTIDLRDPSLVANPSEVPYSLENTGSYMVLRINGDDELLVYHNDGN